MTECPFSLIRGNSCFFFFTHSVLIPGSKCTQFTQFTPPAFLRTLYPPRPDSPAFSALPDFLLGVGRRSAPRGPADLPAAAERHGQADLHLPLPELRRLAARRQLRPRARPALQRRQRGGADARERALHQRAVRRVSGERRTGRA